MAKWLKANEQFGDNYYALLKEWNRFVPEYNAAVAPHKRSVGRPLAASPAQKDDVYGVGIGETGL